MWYTWYIIVKTYKNSEKNNWIEKKRKMAAVTLGEKVQVYVEDKVVFVIFLLINLKLEQKCLVIYSIPGTKKNIGSQ